MNNETVKNALKAHVEFLADDTLKGRLTGSAEYEIAARYVASRFSQFGLQPAGDNNSWFQSVPFIKSIQDSTSLAMILDTSSQQTELKSPQQFVAFSSSGAEQESVRGQLVFVGYGIVSKGLKHDDYTDIDVKGKIVVLLAGRAVAFPSEEGAHVSSIGEKFRHAAERGAIGVISVHTPMFESARPFELFAKFTTAPMMKWQMKDGSAFKGYPTLKGVVFTTIETGKLLFSKADLNLDKVFEQIRTAKVPSGFDMDLTVTLKQKSRHERIYSSNVVGVIEGSDSQLKSEYVVYSAHLDGLGVSTDGSNAVNNGALDNAVGVALLLETARRFKQGPRPKRSILFVVLTAEEQGLLGSSYFAHNPVVPIKSIVANINLDMPFIFHPFADIVAFGQQHSTMGQFLTGTLAKMGLKLSPDPVPEQAAFVRSDHYSFVKQGVPAVFLTPGFASTDPSINGGQMAAEFLGKHYHQSSDDISLPLNYAAGATFTEVNYAIGRDIANALERPRWHDGDFFGELLNNLKKKYTKVKCVVACIRCKSACFGGLTKGVWRIADMSARRISQ
jgi:Zn-dependent M28 family amino/carboxypeptidase